MDLKHSKTIHVGGGVCMFIPQGDVEWQLRYGNCCKSRYVVASLIQSYDYLLSKNITTKEAIRRLRIMRNENND